MKKRRNSIKPKFWLIMATFVICGVLLWVGSQNGEETPKIDECVVSADETTNEKDYILDIPLSCELQEELYQATEEFGVDYYVMIALIDRESKFKNVMGDGGDSYGYCQIQPKWWYGLMVEIGATDLNVPRDNFRVACAIISKLMAKHNSIEGALVEYNQGSYKGNSTPYSREIIENAARYKA